MKDPISQTTQPPETSETYTLHLEWPEFSEVSLPDRKAFEAFMLDIIELGVREFGYEGIQIGEIVPLESGRGRMVEIAGVKPSKKAA